MSHCRQKLDMGGVVGVLPDKAIPKNVRGMACSSECADRKDTLITVATGISAMCFAKRNKRQIARLAGPGIGPRQPR